MGDTNEAIASAQKYLQDKMINDLFNHLATVLVYHQPQDPRKFILEELLRMKKEKSASRHDFFDANDLSTMFSMIDITGKGYITTEQLQQALANLGHAGADVSHLKKGSRLNLEQFMKEASPYITLKL